MFLRPRRRVLTTIGSQRHKARDNDSSCFPTFVVNRLKLFGCFAVGQLQVSILFCHLLSVPPSPLLPSSGAGLASAQPAARAAARPRLPSLPHSLALGRGGPAASSAPAHRPCGLRWRDRAAQAVGWKSKAGEAPRRRPRDAQLPTAPAGSGRGWGGAGTGPPGGLWLLRSGGAGGCRSVGATQRPGVPRVAPTRPIPEALEPVRLFCGDKRHRLVVSECSGAIARKKPACRRLCGAIG